TPEVILPFKRRIVNDFSQLAVEAHVDDRALLDLLDPCVVARVELLAEENLSNLRLDAREPRSLEAVLRLEPEDVIAERRAVGQRDLPGREAENLQLDVLGELAAFQCSEIAAVAGARVLRVLLGELGKVRALEELAADEIGPDAGVLPGRVGGAGVRLDQDVPRLLAQSVFELRAVGLEIPRPLRLGHRNPEPHLPPDDPVAPDLVADPAPDGVDREPLRLEYRVELLAALHIHLLEPVGQLLLDLGVFDDDLIALGLLHLQPLTLHPPH